MEVEAIACLMPLQTSLWIAGSFGEIHQTLSQDKKLVNQSTQRVAQGGKALTPDKKGHMTESDAKFVV
jgi:hypothetical protein